MYSKKDILSRLQAGEDAMVIANEIADVLNGAIDEFNAEQEKISQEDRLNELAAELGKAMYNYLVAAVPDLITETNEDIFSADVIRGVLDQSIPLFTAATAFTKSLKENTNDKLMNTIDNKPSNGIKFNDPLMDFLSKNGLV